jgi:TatD DNase family protein
MEFVDTHAHIYLKDFDEEIGSILNECKNQGVNKILMPNIDCSSIDDMHRIEETYAEHAYSMMGLHPCYVKDDYKEQLAILEKWFSQRSYKGVGEIGIDMYWDKSTKDIQIEAFRTQCLWARSMKLPVSIHSRDALDITIPIIEELQDGNLSGVFHCFNGTVEDGKRIIDAGFYMGIGGVVTFKKAGVDKTVSQLPYESMVLETDAPYLAPTPYRGKQNKPIYIPIIAEKISEVHEVALSEIAKVTTENAYKIFNL